MTPRWHTFDLLAECSGLVHGVFPRQGGVSKGPLSSLNCGFSVGDNPSHVETNISRALEALNIPSYCRVNQKHGKRVVEACPEIDPPEADGLMTDRPDLGLLITHADCQAAIFYDPIHRAIANVHCGWRGNVINIYQETVAALGRRYGSLPQDLLVAISPSLGPKAAEFQNYQKELPRHFWEFQVKPHYFDLWEISRWQLREAGILEHHIEIAGICTHSSPKDWFSYRREGLTGRHGTFVALKS